MKNRNTELNSLFKNTLDSVDQAKWDKICKNYSLDLILNLFIWWVSSKERYLRDDLFVSKWIVYKLKSSKNITYIKPENYRNFLRLFPLFYKFYQENWSDLQDLFGDDIYNNKKNFFIKNPDLKKIIEWQKYLEEDTSKEAKKYLNKLKYIYRIFPENELEEIFKLYINWAYKLHDLNSWYEDILKDKKPFDVVIKIIDDNIFKKFGRIGQENQKIINSLFSRYLFVLKYNKKQTEVLSVDNKESKWIQWKTKNNLINNFNDKEDDWYDEIKNIISVRTKDGWSEDVDYVDGDPVAPRWNFMVESPVDGEDCDDTEKSIYDL